MILSSDIFFKKILTLVLNIGVCEHKSGTLTFGIRIS